MGKLIDFIGCIFIQLFFTALIGFGLFFMFIAEDRMIEKQCNGLSGYDYGRCQMQVMH